MNMKGSHSTMKNCEASTGTRNRLLGGQDRSFQLIERHGGVPFWGGAGHRNGIGTSRTMKIIKPYNFMRAPRLRASPRHGEAVRCLQLYVLETDPPRGRPVGGGGVHRK